MRRLLIPLVLLAACAPTPYRLGQRAADEGQFYDATQIWLKALDEDIYATKPRNALMQYAEQAYNARLDKAREHEASAQYAESAAAYESLFQLEKDLESVELLDFRTPNTRTEHTQLMATWADAEFQAGRDDDAKRQWAEAVAHFEKVRELQPKYPQLDSKQGFTNLLWAEEDLHFHRYIEASEHYRESHRLTGHRETAEWASAVDAAIGRHALDNGFCRVAVERFETAGEIPSDPTLKADRARAADCARIAVVVQPMTTEVELPAEHAALASTLVDRLERVIDTGSSSYVRMYAGDVLETAEDAPETQFRVEGRMTQVAVEPESTSETKQTTEGEWLVDCDKETLIYEPDAICTDPVEVEYTLHRKAQVVRMAGSVKVVDLTTGEQNTRPLAITLTTDTRHAAGFQVFLEGSWVPVAVGTEADMGRVGLPNEVLALDRGAQPLPPVSETLGQAIDLLADEAGTAVLGIVDATESMPPPERLEVRSPTLLPENLSFEQVAPPLEPPRMEAELLPSVQAGKLVRNARESVADPSAAMELNDQALAIDPDNANARSFSALLIANAGLLAPAERRIREVLEAHPESARVWGDLGLVLAKQERTDEARDALVKAQALGLADADVEAALAPLR